MTSAKKTATWSTWESPITTNIVSGSNLSFKEVHVNQSTGAIYIVESRPSEKGHCAIVEVNSQPQGAKSIDKLPGNFSVCSKVHEYGGGAMVMSPDGDFVITDANTDGVFSISPSGEIKSEIIKGDPSFRYADFDVHPGGEFILAIQEEHRGKEVINTLIAIDVRGNRATIIVEGADFYSHPKFNHGGKKVSWMQWNHPDMPWTGSELYAADWHDGRVVNSIKVAGKARLESINQPKWHLDDTLLFSSDVTGFYQLYLYDTKTEKAEQLGLDGFQDADLTTREFSLGACSYVSMTKDLLAIVYTRNANTGLVLYNLKTETTTPLITSLIDIETICRISDTQVVAISGTRDAPIGVYLVDITTSSQALLKSSSTVALDPSLFSLGRTITFPRIHGSELGTPSHAIFIPPHNPSFSAPQSSWPPPLIVWAHGGPTGHSPSSLDLKAQYYTSRGYAYCLVNYAGSTGYGRKYREMLDYNWGIKDCEDVVSCVEYLAKQCWIDKDKVGITGRSSGGYTVLQSMVSFPKVFAAGCSLFGIGNLKLLAQDSHKFESHYLFDLIFPETATDEEKEKVYADRSPCFHADKIEKPLVLLQGDLDKVVPMGQAVEMEKVLKSQGKDVKLVVFEGEGHGFKMEENLSRAVEEEEGLWRRTLLYS